MEFPVKMALEKDGFPYLEKVANEGADLCCRIEMLTGIVWLDTAPLYQKLVDRGCDEATTTFKVCNSYEKWGGWQQEVAKIRVRMARL